ncbi:hypothetical protein [Paraburkholderia sp. GAS348]|uniref:hypothetical protein n=1 Tax=Paraburkholderia sp. GAS348 TaxID=3035132 RepID=UPI003D1C0F13
MLTFFAAAKKVSAAPHRGNANKPRTIQGKAKNPDQGKAKTISAQTKSSEEAKKQGKTTAAGKQKSKRQTGKKTPTRRRQKTPIPRLKGKNQR